MKAGIAFFLALLWTLTSCTSSDDAPPKAPTQVSREVLEDRFESAMGDFPDARACGSDVVDGVPTVYAIAPPGSTAADFRTDLAEAMNVPESQLDVLDSSYICGPD